MTNKEAEWDSLFKDIKLTKIPFPSKLSVEYLDVIKKYLPKRARILEAGSGSGEISAYLAQNGYDTYLLDKSEAAINLSKRLFKKFDLKGNFIQGNLFKIPFSENYFDCVWNSCVLEHFSDEAVVKALKEMARVSNNLVISLVPNAQSVIYRLAKLKNERVGTWLYGQESPKYTQSNYFKQAGLYLLEERTIGKYFGIMWLKELTKIPKKTLSELTYWVEEFREEKLLDSISYLLLTIGTKKGGAAAKKGIQTHHLKEKENEISKLNEIIITQRRKINSLEKFANEVRSSRFWKIYRLIKK